MSIASDLQRIVDAKAAIKTAIEFRGMTVPSSATIDHYADLVSCIDGFRFTLASDSASGTITLNIVSGVGVSTYEYAEWSLDGITWTRVNNIDSTNVTVTTSTLTAGMTVYFRGKGTAMAVSNTTYCYFSFSSGVKAYAKGSIMDMIGTDTMGNYCFESLFINCTGLISAPDLPATTLVSYCYADMFNGCTALTTPPAILPATTLQSRCYYAMFANCSALTHAPVLPAVTLVTNCYRQMFQNCTKMSYIKAMFTNTPGTTYCSAWVSGVASAGIFVKNTLATWTNTGTSAMPSGWTAVTSAT